MVFTDDYAICIFDTFTLLMQYVVSNLSNYTLLIREGEVGVSTNCKSYAKLQTTA